MADGNSQIPKTALQAHTGDPVSYYVSVPRPPRGRAARTGKAVLIVPVGGERWLADVGFGLMVYPLAVLVRTAICGALWPRSLGCARCDACTALYAWSSGTLADAPVNRRWEPPSGPADVCRTCSREPAAEDIAAGQGYGFGEIGAPFGKLFDAAGQVLKGANITPEDEVEFLRILQAVSTPNPCGCYYDSRLPKVTWGANFG
ncbi:hypothetical protein PsYK624_104390 [Phanerochaete sordida]|uniref:Uncharacterized protein n=1 Tax=Phanerochaete sordida TaxID=48140 RepID=A0A9P3LGF3_9APHY|nr:hypothetical protein PsYK624_104390 [Phanerochaete sordida]